MLMCVASGRRPCGVWAASRFGMLGGMDAMCWSERRPDCGWREKWTPCVDVGGVQNWDVERNGRQCADEGGVQINV